MARCGSGSTSSVPGGATATVGPQPAVVLDDYPSLDFPRGYYTGIGTRKVYFNGNSTKHMYQIVRSQSDSLAGEQLRAAYEIENARNIVTLGTNFWTTMVHDEMIYTGGYEFMVAAPRRPGEYWTVIHYAYDARRR